MIDEESTKHRSFSGTFQSKLYRKAKMSHSVPSQGTGQAPGVLYLVSGQGRGFTAGVANS